MNDDTSGEVSSDWDSEDEVLKKGSTLLSCSDVMLPDGVEVNGNLEEASTSLGPSNSKLILHFSGMGFSKKLVAKAIEENGPENTESILESLLTYSALESTHEEDSDFDFCSSSSGYEENLLHDFSDIDSCPEIEDSSEPSSMKEKTLLLLADMGYPVEEASIAIERCGLGTSIDELTNFITAAQVSREEDVYLPPEEKPSLNRSNDFSRDRKRKPAGYDSWREKKSRSNNGRLVGECDMISLPNPMTGFGVPSRTGCVTSRSLPEGFTGPPYFYYENVALAPKGVWQTISRFLGNIQPEFVDSKYFCAAARKRGYVHNLPIDGRYQLLPLPAQTIFEALPLTKKWWPAWDQRTKLNCLQTVIGSAKLTERIRKALEDWDDTPPISVQKYVLNECKKWNLVWVGRNKLAPLEADEVEMLLGFPRNHTRGGGISRTDRYKSLGNSFQVDTVAYHLSVLKGMFPRGINVLSLFSGIGGAEVALHRLGIPLNNVVSVEISETNRSIMRSWWEQTNQRGRLIDIADVNQLSAARLEDLISTLGGFDFIVGGSPCNNLAGSNRVSRDGLEGEHSVLFYEFYRILDAVQRIMRKTR